LKGFYWDISDWSGGIASIDPNGMQKLNNNQTINTKVPPNPQLLKITTDLSNELNSNLDFSPIYSKVFNNKNGISKISEFEDDEKTPKNSNSEDDEDFNKNELVDLTSFKPNNYMYLLNTDECDQTFESRSNGDNQSNHQVKLVKNSDSNLVINDDEYQMNGEGFSMFKPKTSSTLSISLSKNDNDDDYFMPSLFKNKNTKSSKPINL
jgi:hypothetical protein